MKRASLPHCVERVLLGQSVSCSPALLSGSEDQGSVDSRTSRQSYELAASWWWSWDGDWDFSGSWTRKRAPSPIRQHTWTLPQHYTANKYCGNSSFHAWKLLFPRSFHGISTKIKFPRHFHVSFRKSTANPLRFLPTLFSKPFPRHFHDGQTFPRHFHGRPRSCRA